MKKVALGSDHRGVELKQAIIKALSEMNYEYKDFGAFSYDPVDYPDYAIVVAGQVSEGKFEYGILICGTGMGMCIVANRFKGVRATVCRNEFEARRARQHNNANVLCLGGDTTNINLAIDIVRIFLSTDFEGGRHQRRVDKIDSIKIQ